MEALASAFCGLGFALEDVVDIFFLVVGREADEEAAEDELLSLTERDGWEHFPPLDEVEEDEEEEDAEDFILASSASKAGARVLTTASRSDCFDRDWTARRTK